MTLVEKILAKKAGKEAVRPDELVEVSVDRAMIHGLCDVSNYH